MTTTLPPPPAQLTTTAPAHADDSEGTAKSWLPEMSGQLNHRFFYI